MMKSYAEKDVQYTKKLFVFSSKMIFSLLFIIIAPIFVEIKFILNIWLGQVGLYMPEFVRVMLIYVIVLCVSEPITTIVQAAGKVKLYHGIVDSFTLFTLPLSYILFKNGMAPFYGFAISILIFIIAHFMRLHILKSFFNFSIYSYLLGFIIPAVVITVLTFFIVISLQPIINNSIVTMGISMAIATITIFFFLLDTPERQYIINMLKTKLQRQHE